MNNIIILKARSNTNVHHLKTAIVSNIIAGDIVCIDTKGLDSNYIVLKSMIITKSQLSTRNYSITTKPLNTDSPVDSNIKMGIQWQIRDLKKVIINLKKSTYRIISYIDFTY